MSDDLKDAWHDGYAAGVTAARQGRVPGVARVDRLRARIEALPAIRYDWVSKRDVLAVFDE